MLHVTEEISWIMAIHSQRAYNYFGKVIASKEEKQKLYLLKNSNKFSFTYLL